MIAELKPCPLCGGPAHHNDGGNSRYGRFWWAVGCHDCEVYLSDREVFVAGGQLDPAYPPKECFTRWNSRPSNSADALERWNAGVAKARIAELEGFLEEVISRTPEVHRTWVRDPQDEIPDLIEHEELLVLQEDARELLKGGA